MPLKDKNQLLLAYKKLAGKMHTNPEFGVGNETISTFTQLNSQQIFAQSITQDPTNSPVQLVTLNVTEYSSGFYSSSEDITNVSHTDTARSHTFSLSLKDAVGNFSAGTFIKDENKLQLISDNYGLVYYPKLYYVDAQNNRQEISKLSEINWVIDYSSGVIFVQDNTNNNFPSDSISWEVDAYIYTGQYLDEAVVAASQTGGGGSSASDDLLIIDIDSPEDTDIIDGKVSIVFEDSPFSDPQPDLKAAIAYQEGSLEFYTQYLNTNNIVMTLNGDTVEAKKIKAFGPQSSVQYHNLLGKISGSEYFVWDEENLFLTASNLFTNTITSSVITSSNIVGYGIGGSVQFKNPDGYITGSDNFVWDDEKLFILTSIFANHSTASYMTVEHDFTSSTGRFTTSLNVDGTITSTNIVGYGTEGSVQFKNSQNYMTGSDSFVWNETSNTLSVTNIAVNGQGTFNSIDVTGQGSFNSINVTEGGSFNSITANSITINGDDSIISSNILGAAGSNTQIQYNNNGKLGASDKLTFEQSGNIFSLKVNDSANSNSAELFVNTNTDGKDLETSGLLLSNTVDSGIKYFKIDRQHTDVTDIYMIDSDLPLYINSDTQNLLTAGTSKLDMSIGKVEFWPNSSKYLKVNTDNITTNISNFIFENSSGDILVDTNDISARFTNTGITLVGDTISYFIGNPLEGNASLVNRSYAKINFGLSLDTNYYSTITSDTRNYEQAIPGSEETTTHPTSYQSFSVKVDDQLNKILEINKDGIIVESSDTSSTEIYLQNKPVSTVNHVFLDHKYTKEYETALDHTAQHEIMRFPIAAGKKYCIDVEMYISWYIGQIYQYDSGGNIVATNQHPLLTIGTPIISMSHYVDNDGVPLTGCFTLHRNIYKYTKTGTLSGNEPKYARDLLFSLPFRKLSNAGIFTLYDVDELEQTTGDNGDIMLCSFSSFIIDLPFYSGNSEIVISMIPPAPSTDIGDSANLINYNTTHSQVGAGTYHYKSSNKTSLSVNTPTNIKVTRIW